MRRLGFVFALVCLIQLTTGCFVVGARSPGDLMEPPSLGASKQTIKDFVDSKMLKDERLYKPENPSDMSAINFVDLDIDGTDEAVVYFKDSTNYRLGAYIFVNETGAWKVASKIESSGVDISYSGFYDLTGNGKKEIVMAWSADKLDIFMDKYVSIYSYDGNLDELYHDTYTEMAVGDFYGNESSEMLLLNLDRNVSEPSSTARLVAFSDGGFDVEDTIRLDPYINGYYNILVGNAHGNTKGIFLDMGIGAHSAATYLLVVEEGRIVNVFPNTLDTIKPYSVESRDINGDGTIEIGMLEEPRGNTNPMSSTPWISNWYQWDGDKGLERVAQNFINRSDNLMIDFPEAWTDRVTISYSGESQNILKIGFVDGADSEVYPLYEIIKVREEKLDEETSERESGWFKVESINGFVFVVVKSNEAVSVPYSIKKEYGEAVLSEQEMKGIIKIWR